MLIYVTGASGTGKTTLLRQAPIKGYDLDDLYLAAWKKHRKMETVHRAVGQEIQRLVAKHSTLLLVGLQMKEALPIAPDRVYILVRKDYEQYYRDKLLRDLQTLCQHRGEYEEVLRKEPVEEFRSHFMGVNGITQLESLKDFKARAERATKAIQADFPEGRVMEFEGVLKALKGV